MIFRQIDCPIYGETILFYSECTLAQLKKHLIKHYKPNPSELDIPTRCRNQLGLFRVIDGYYVIWYREPADVASLVHEIYHLCAHIFDEKGIPISLENDEAMAYYLGYWVSQFAQILEDEQANRTETSMKKNSKRRENVSCT